MKIIVASFQCESNSKAKIYPKKEDFEYFKGEDIFQKLAVKDIFESNGFEVIPSIYAVALPSATVKKETYDFYADQILQTVKENSDAKGVFIFFHGSMEVEEIGSGELYLLKQMRYNCINAVAIYTRFARMRYDINPRITPKAYRFAKQNITATQYHSPSGEYRCKNRNDFYFFLHSKQSQLLFS